MKIMCFLGGYFGELFGGAEIQTSLLIDHWLSRGCEVAYVCYGSSTSSGPEVLENGMRLYRIKKPFQNIKPLIYLERSAIRSILERERPDVVYQRGDFYFCDIVTAFGKRMGFPVVNGLSMERHCMRVKKRFNHMYIFDLLMDGFVRNYYRDGSVIISQTDHQRQCLKENFGRDSVIIANGHPVPDPPFEKTDPPTLLWVANIKPIKRPNLFFEVTSRIKGDIRIRMIGNLYKEVDNDWFHGKVKEDSRITYLGEQPLEVTNVEIAKASVLLNTSETEGFSNTYIQAWMRQTPVFTISADPDGTIQKRGIGIREEDTVKMSEAISHLFQDKDELRRMGEKARCFAMEHFSIDTIGDRYLEVFQGAIDKYDKERTPSA